MFTGITEQNAILSILESHPIAVVDVALKYVHCALKFMCMEPRVTRVFL